MPTEKRGVKALQIWCRRVTNSYENVNILDMDSSWRDGLAFCALIHHFRPSLLDYDILSQENILENNSLAYKVAEEELGIPSLLDPQDMLDTDVPDKFSIVTYVSQFYHLLKDEDNSRSPSLPVKEILNTSYDSADNSPQGTPKSVPRSVFLSSNPILRNNKFSPQNTPLSQTPKDKDKSQVTVVAISAVCQDFENKINIFQKS
eukprot:GFUD01017613.1.p1 GENE.GFUD01017613.1~~GFUD01017613.1.p1  ORF type:complete len:204 (+),score=79.11 GFUD01017613.1:206-817(+)